MFANEQRRVTVSNHTVESERSLPTPGSLFPRGTAIAIAWFWARYWAWFFALLPWMLLRQAFVTAYSAVALVATWNRRVELLGGRLQIQFLNSLRALPATLVFGERFTAIHYADALIDPGPPFARERMERYAERNRLRISAILATHFHEEHVGNAASLARVTAAPVHATAATCSIAAAGAPLYGPRRFFIGQPEAVPREVLRPLGARIRTAAVELDVIASPGHCDGHASFFDPVTGILFAGDSFLHTVFTSPNADVSGLEWIRTLERYASWDVRTMIGTHGYVLSIDPSIPPRPLVVRRADPRLLIRRKLAFLRWAREVVAEGETRGLPYSVIEACLFPWQRWWAAGNWFVDESGRLFTAGEFSRTHFVRSLSRTPERVPERFPRLATLARALATRLRRHAQPGSRSAPTPR